MSTGIRIIFFLCLVARLVEGNKCSLAEPFRLAPAKGNCPGKVGCWCSNGQCTQCAGSGLNGGHGVYCPGDQRQHLCPPNQWIPFSGCDCGSSGGGDPNQGHCYDCPAGQQPTSDQSGCQSCSFPLYNPTSGGTCGPCPANQYWTSPSSCTPCPAGTSGGGGNVSSCVPCQYPLYNPTAGGECVACPASTCWQSAISCGPCSVNASCSPQIYSKQYDYVVVGTGPAAGPIIRRLADAGHSVLVLEQGPYFYQQDQGNPASKPNTDKQPQFDDEFQVKESVWQFPSTTVSCPTTERGLWKRASVHEDSLATALGVRSDLFTRSLRMGDFNDDKDTMDETSGRKFRRKRRYPYAQVQGFGGNTLTYGGLHLRPSPDAFATWPDGFSFDEMLPWYMKMEQFSFACSANNTGFPDPNLAHNCKAPQGYIHVNLQREDEYPALVASVPQYCAGGKERHEWLNTCGSADAVDYNGAYPVRAFCGPPQFSGTVQEDPKGNPVTLTRDTLQKTYLPASYITNSSLVTVCLSTTVRRLILDNNNTIVGAQLAGTEKVVTGRRFILISGVRHTPEILMSSGIGSSEELSKFNVPTYIDLPAVGKFFHDEWAYALSFTVSDNANNYWIPSESSIVNRNQLHLVKFVSSIQTRNFTDVQLYLRLENKLSLDDYLPPEDFGGSTYGDSFTVRVALFQIDTFGNRSGVHAVASNGVYVDRFNFSIDMFQSENLLQRFMCGAWEGFNETCHLLEALTNQVDPSGKSLVLTPSEPTRKLIAAAQAGVEEFEKVLSNEAMVLALHGGGTCRMGDCVDTTFKVIGTQNLFVCDMSIFPNPVDANPTATLFALGERLAAQLIQEPPSILH